MFCKQACHPFLVPEELINNNIENKIKCIYWFKYKIVTDSHKKEVIVNFNFTQINSWCINYNQYIENKIKNKLPIKAINYACFKLEEKGTRSVKKDKSNFIVTGDKFALSIRWGKLIISFC